MAVAQRTGVATAIEPNAFAGSLKDAAVAAFLVGVLGFFFLPLRTDIAPGGLAVSYR